jgi:DNA protecting protein DprA
VTSHPAVHSSAGEPVADVAYAVALAGLREMTPVRLSRLLRDRKASEVFEQLIAHDPSLVDRLVEVASFGRSGSPGGRAGATAERDPGSLPPEKSWGASGSSPDEERRRRVRTVLRAWADEAETLDPDTCLRALTSRGISVARRGGSRYPNRLLLAQTAPEIIYFKGSLEPAGGRTVGIVGTRRPTPYGRSVAAEFGRELAAHGVAVVSGLAAGIDAAAHWGALQGAASAAPVGIVGGGVDVVYPRENAPLWNAVIAAGGVLSDASPGAAPEAWRFPLRNRLIAALSQVLVVVESTRKGGAMHTVQAADAIGVPVLAVPGSVRSPQSEGTNAILHDGAGVALDVSDVLVVLEMQGAGKAAEQSEEAPSEGSEKVVSARHEKRTKEVARLLTRCDDDEKRVYEAVADTPTSLDVICLHCRLDFGTAALCLDRLSELGLVRSFGSDWSRV